MMNVSAVATAGILMGTTTVQSVGGLVSFTDLYVTGAGASGSYRTLVFSASGFGGSLSPTITSHFTVTPAVAVKLVIVQSPTEAVSGEAFSTQPVIHIVDSEGRLVYDGADSTLVVTASLHVGPGSLGSVVSASAVSGVATFAGLSIVGSFGDGRVLAFSATGTVSGELPAVIGGAILVATVPDAPISPAITGVMNHSVSFWWPTPFNGGANITAFIVYHRDIGGEWDNGILLTRNISAILNATNNYTFDGLTGRTSYKFKVLH